MIRRNAIGTGIGVIGLITGLPLFQGSGSLSLNASAFDLVKSSAIRTSSAGAAGGPSVTPQRESNSTSAVMGIIQGTLDSVSGLQAQIQQLLEAIKSHLVNKPKLPGTNATTEEKTQYQVALRKWESQLVGLHKQLSGQQKRLQQMEAKLSDLQNRQLPEAQRKDAKKTRAAREAEGGKDAQDMRRNR